MNKEDIKLKLNVEYKDRVDKYIAENSEYSRSDIKKLIDNHAVFVNDTSVRKANFTVQPGNVIYVTAIIQREINAQPENIQLDVVFEDEDIVIINKPTGMVVHPAPGHHSGTLVNALLYHFKDLSDITGQVRPGIVHRIDKDTSGLLVVAKNNEAHQFLADELKQHAVKRTYYAWVQGRIEQKILHIDLPIGRDEKDRQKMAVTKHNSKQAITHVFVEKVLSDRTLVRCELETGRTHQIRVHLAYIKHPIIGDPVYGKRIDDLGQRLHATRLELIHPRTKELMKFEIPLPKEFEDLN